MTSWISVFLILQFLWHFLMLFSFSGCTQQVRSPLIWSNNLGSTWPNLATKKVEKNGREESWKLFIEVWRIGASSHLWLPSCSQDIFGAPPPDPSTTNRKSSCDDQLNFSFFDPTIPLAFSYALFFQRLHSASSFTIDLIKQSRVNMTQSGNEKSGEEWARGVMETIYRSLTDRCLISLMVAVLFSRYLWGSTTGPLHHQQEEQLRWPVEFQFFWSYNSSGIFLCSFLSAVALSKFVHHWFDQTISGQHDPIWQRKKWRRMGERSHIYTYIYIYYRPICIHCRHLYSYVTSLARICPYAFLSFLCVTFLAAGNRRILGTARAPVAARETRCFTTLFDGHKKKHWENFSIWIWICQQVTDRLEDLVAR